MKSAIARRYAKALFQLCHQEGTLEESRASLEQLAEILGYHEDLQNVCSNPIFSREDRRRVLKQVMSRLDAPPVVQRFLDLLVVKHRLLYLPEIAQAFAAMVDEQQGRQTVRVRVPEALGAQSQSRLQSRLAEVLGKQVTLTVEAEPSLIAGMVIQMGSEVFDGSVRGRLNDLRRTLSRRM